MAKIPRAQHKVFGAAGTSDNFAKFGSEVAGAPVKTKDIATIQSLPAWNDGFQDAIYGANKALLLEDLNAFALEHSTQIGYLLSLGAPEWQAATEYSKGSVAQRTTGLGDATGELYASLIDANIGNALPIQASNGNWLWLNPPAATPSGAFAANSIPKVSGAASVGFPGSQTLVSGILSDDGTNVIIGGTAGVQGLKFPDATVQKTAAVNAVATTQSPPTAYAGSPTRVVGATYQNTSSKPIYVGITFYGSGGVMAYCDNTATPTQVVGACSSSGSAPDNASMFFIVLPGYYYKLAGSTVAAWVEWT